MVLCIAKERFVDGFDNQSQFRMLDLEDVRDIADKVAASSAPHMLYVLHLFQRDIDAAVEKLEPGHAVVVRGSYKQAFHTRRTFYTLARQNIGFEYASPFTGEDEAKAFAASHQISVPTKSGDAETMMRYTRAVATKSYDYSYQTGCALTKFSGGHHTLIASAHNAVIPYQTYAMHHGNSREDNYAAPNDTNHYDTVHAEMQLVIEMMRSGLSMEGLTLFVSTLPCPTCARNLSQTGIAEVIYELDHSEGYAVKLFERCGIKTTRLLQ